MIKIHLSFGAKLPLAAGAQTVSVDFILPKDIYFSELHVKTAWDYHAGWGSGIHAGYVVVKHFLNAENVTENTPLIIWEGWVRTTNTQQPLRIPINCLVDLYSTGKFNVTMSFLLTSYHGGTVDFDALYFDFIYPASGNYRFEEHRGAYFYRADFKASANGPVTININPETGESFIITSILMYPQSVAGARECRIRLSDLERGKDLTYSLVGADRAYYPGELLPIKLEAINHKIEFRGGVSFLKDEKLRIMIHGYLRTAKEPAFTLTNCVADSEEKYIY